jgi:predicted deacylase
MKTKTVSHIPLLSPAPGTRRELVVHRYGEPGAGPKAYIQASLHADEIPAMLVAHHLVRRLDAADAEGAIVGEIAVVPAANPIGLAQFVNGGHAGRHELGGGGNFNRNWPNLADLVGDDLAEMVDYDPGANQLIIRTAVAKAVEAMTPRNELQSLRIALLRLAHDADIVLDLHCDNDALTHLFLTPHHWPEADDLARRIGSRATLLAVDSGGNSFDEVFTGLWHDLAARFGPDRKIPQACLSATVELRGYADVSDDLAEADADSLFRFLQGRGVVSGDPGPLPEPVGEAAPLTAVDVVRVPCAGVVAYKVALGEEVAAGDVIAEIVDPMAEDAAKARTPVRAATAGPIYSLRTDKFVRPGDTIAKIRGREPLPSRKGNLLED